MASQDGDSPQPEPYNPLDRLSLAKSMEAELMSRDSERLDQVPRFRGAGIYVIYYTGTHQLYAPITGTDTPIYVGKAVPPGARKALNDPGRLGSPLFNRINQHRQSIDSAHDLDAAEFRVRRLVADELFIELTETLMIRTLRPVWNQAVDGFGNHNPGQRRNTGRVTDWDTLHPGRPWAARMTQRSAQERDAIIARVRDHFGQPASPE